MNEKNIWQAIKFTLFSISAGVIQFGSYTLFKELLNFEDWLAHLIALVLSVIWNFTLNRRYTFKSAANVPIAMLKIAAFYLVFTPLSTWLVDLATDAGVNGYITEIGTMLSNFILEFLFCKFVVYRGQEDTLKKAQKN